MIHRFSRSHWSFHVLAQLHLFLVSCSCGVLLSPSSICLVIIATCTSHSSFQVGRGVGLTLKSWKCVYSRPHYLWAPSTNALLPQITSSTSAIFHEKVLILHNAPPNVDIIILWTLNMNSAAGLLLLPHPEVVPDYVQILQSVSEISARYIIIWVFRHPHKRSLSSCTIFILQLDRMESGSSVQT